MTTSMSTGVGPGIDVQPGQWPIVRDLLRRHVPQCEVWAFGSRAKWTAKPFSDLDLVVIAELPLSLDTLARLSDDFSQSNLPWKVDVVDWAVTSEVFRSIISRDKVVVQQATAQQTKPKSDPSPHQELP